MRTRDAQFARDRLAAQYNLQSFDTRTGEDQPFGVVANHLQIGGLGLSFCNYESPVELGFGAEPVVRQFMNVGDIAGRWDIGSRFGDIAPHRWSGVLPAGVPMKLTYDAGYRQLVLRIAEDDLMRGLRTLTGSDAAAPLVFDDEAGSDTSLRRLYQRVLQFAWDFDRDGAHFSDIAAAEISRHLVIEFLIFNRHSYSHLLLREPAAIAPAAIRKVEEYIEANWDSSIDVDTMAEVSGVSARSLWRYFRKHRNCSPADFLKQTRLRRAREMLEAPRSDTTVTQVALKCGFQNAGRFAREFRDLFGEMPSETLRRAKN